MSRVQIAAILAIVVLLLCSCSDDTKQTHVWHETTVVLEDNTPDVIVQEDSTIDVLSVVRTIREEDSTTDVVVIHETKTIIEEDTTPDVVTIYEYPSGPVPCLMLVEGGAPAMADSPISGLTAATEILDPDLFAITQSGTSKKATADLVRRLAFLDPRYGFLLNEEWVNNQVAGNNNWQTTVNGTGATVDLTTAIANRVAVPRLQTGTTATGRAALHLGVSSLSAAEGEIEFDIGVFVPQLSTSGERFTLYVGFGNVDTGGDMNDGIYFRYSDNLSSGNWERCTADGTRTQQSTGIAVNATNWFNLGAKVNTDASSVEFFINGASAGTITTNIPSFVTDPFGPLIKIEKSIGTSNVMAYLDNAQIRRRFSTPRPY